MVITIRRTFLAFFSIIGTGLRVMRGHTVQHAIRRAVRQTQVHAEHWRRERGRERRARNAMRAASALRSVRRISVGRR
jgi:hypothetical protein